MRSRAGLVAPDMTIWMGPLGHIVIYYIRGGQFVNMVASRETETWVEESWSIESSAQEMSAAFPKVGDDMRMLIDRAQNVVQMGIVRSRSAAVVEQGPHHAAGRRRASDAAIPRRRAPAMAIEDGFVLAREAGGLTQTTSPAALQRYEAIRRQRTRRGAARRARAGQYFPPDVAGRTAQALAQGSIASPDPIEAAQSRLALRA
jgi:salicylate hydroxylase